MLDVGEDAGLSDAEGDVPSAQTAHIESVITETSARTPADLVAKARVALHAAENGTASENEIDLVASLLADLDALAVAGGAAVAA